jgi:hypothetical protein
MEPWEGSRPPANGLERAKLVLAHTTVILRLRTRLQEISNDELITDMARKLVKLKIRRQPGFMYYIKDGGVWSVPMKRKGVKAKGRKQKVVQFAKKGDLDLSSSIYFLDKDGDVAVAPRGRRKAKRK